MQSTLNFVLSRKFFKMAAKSYQQRQQMIDSATDTTTGSVAWDGTNGLDNILSSLNEAIKNNGNLYYPDATALANAGFIDGGYAVITNSSLLAFYKWFGVVDPDLDDCITSLAGGQWRPVFAVTTPIEGPWEVIDGNIVPKTANLDSGVGIGQATVADGLWMDFATLGDDGKARGVKFPVLTTTQVNAKTLVENEFFYNTNDKMLLRYDAAEENTKSAGVLSFSTEIVANGSTATFTVNMPLGAEQHVTGYKVTSPTALNTASATALKLGWYITNKTSNSFNLVFQSNPVAGTLNFDFTISGVKAVVCNVSVFMVLFFIG